jgi:UDP-GlcNAc:undecaprenyl-phosphate GlcNAc-1-phosphate transferase
MRTYLCVYFGSAYLALIATPLVIWLARRIGAMDRPDIRSVHTRPIPRIGGIAIYLSSVCLIVALLFLNNAIGARFWQVRLQVITLLGAATGVFLIGLIDDLRGLPARCKFLVELSGAGALCLVGVKISSIGLDEGSAIRLGWLGWPLTLLWIVGVTNAVNMSDGLDGLAAGIAAIACAVIAVFAVQGSTIHTGLAQSNDIMMALFSLALLGGLSGFLFFNFNPAKVFMGDCGSLFLGFTIASASVMCVSKSAALVGLALPALALGIPIFDTLFSMLRRFLERRSLFAPDRSHFHHRLIELGLNQRRAVMIVYTATLATAGLGLFMLVNESLRSLLVFGGVLCLIVLLFRVVGAIRLGETLARLQSKYRYSCRVRDDRRTFENLQLRFRQVLSADQRWQAICEAARRMDFAWVSVKTTYEDGRIETEVWRPAHAPPPDPSQLVTMTIPFQNGDPHVVQEFEIALSVGGSYETLARRATLFGRLLDESESLRSPQRSAPATGAHSPNAGRPAR